MKTNKLNIVFSLLAWIMLAFSACQPEEYSLGEMISKDDLQYSITQDSDDPNLVILESETPGVTPLWVTPMGRSTSVNDTVKIPFAGEYDFVYGVQSDGGFVRADTFNLEITTNNLMYVEDPLWEKLTGGVGEEKTWLLDLDADGVSKYFDGPLYFYGTDDSWETVTEGEEVDGDSWNWKPSWEGNQWLMPEGDYGTMTFRLKDNATVTVNHEMLGRQEEGTYFLDADAKTLSMTDAAPLHDEERDDQVSSWGDIKVLSLTEDAMQLAVLRDQSDEGEALLVYNFISKEYAENWEPTDQADPEPELPEGWKEEVSKVVNKEITWKLSEQNPLDWCNLDGSRINGWETPEDYPDWLGTPDPSEYEDFALTLNSEDNTVVFNSPDGTTQEGTYELDEKGIYTFTDISPDFTIVGWANFSLTEDDQLRIMSIEKNDAGDVTDMWVGAKDPEKPEYMAYHLVPEISGGGDGENEAQGTQLDFDNSKLDFGDLEDNGNFRLELYNDFGSTAEDPPLNPEDVIFENKVEVTFTLEGVTLSDGAEGSYNTAFQLASTDWDFEYFGDGTDSGVATVTGDGTYTTTFEPESAYEGALVFAVDILDLSADIDDMSSVDVTIDEVVLY